MRVIVTKLMDKGLARKTRAAPIDAQLRSHRDDAGRLVYQLYYLDKGGAEPIVGDLLISPQAGDIGPRTAIYFGFERAGTAGQLFAQAWEVELPSRR